MTKTRPEPDRVAEATLDSMRERRIAEAAARAKAEAAARRSSIDAVSKCLPREVQGRDGPEPIRYGDWEIDGRASDF